MKIYVASSWKNDHQPRVVEVLRAQGHEVYDFKNPPDKAGFGWEEIEGGASSWTVPQFIKNLEHPAAIAGFNADFDAMLWCDAVVMVGPCGSSAHLELGWGAGAGKKTIVFLPAHREPELMIKVADLITTSLDNVVEYLAPKEAPLFDWDMPFGTAVTTPEYIWHDPIVGDRGRGMTTNQLRYAVALVRAGLDVLWVSHNRSNRDAELRWAATELMPSRYFVGNPHGKLYRCPDQNSSIRFTSIESGKRNIMGFRGAVLLDHHVAASEDCAEIVTIAKSRNHVIYEQAGHILPPEYPK